MGTVAQEGLADLPVSSLVKKVGQKENQKLDHDGYCKAK